MDKNMVHLAQITIANLTAGTVNPTEKEIIDAMNRALAKEQDMTNQISKSFNGKRAVFDAFTHGMAGLIHDAVNLK